MLNGFNFLMCGSGPITNSHLKVLKCFHQVKLKKIFSKNVPKANEIATNFKLNLLNNLNKENIDDCNVCLITNSSENHFDLIKTLSNQIKIFIVEKPIVEDSTQLKELAYLIKNRNLKVFEVSQFLFSNKIEKIRVKKKLKILIKKKRVYADFINFKDIRSRDKSIVFRQLPHWYDVAKKITGGNISLNKVEANTQDQNVNYLKVYLSNTSRMDVEIEIEIDLNCEKNYSPVILADNKEIVLKQSIWNKFYNTISFKNLNMTEIYLKNMYENFLFKTKENEYENIIDFEKYKIFEKIFPKLGF